MNCPSCQCPNSEEAKFCGRCRMAFSPRNLLFSKARDHIYWILRRSNAGLFTGMVGWFFIPILSSALAKFKFDLLQFMAEGMLGGAFLGTVDGMLEESTTKTFRGAILGGMGGIAGGLVFGLLNPQSSPAQTEAGMFLFWGLAGGFIGLVSAAWERKASKIIIGILSGVIGGGIGGWLGILTYANLLQEYPQRTWWMEKSFPLVVGGILGLSLWFVLGTAERFFIFRRRPLVDGSHKHCDHCEHKNPLNFWYCEQCGSVLQSAAPASSLNLPPYLTLERLQKVFSFLSRLSAASIFIAGTVIILISIIFLLNPFLSLVALVIVAIIGYSLLILFSSLAELIQIYTKK